MGGVRWGVGSVVECRGGAIQQLRNGLLPVDDASKRLDETKRTCFFPLPPPASAAAAAQPLNHARTQRHWITHQAAPGSASSAAVNTMNACT